MGDRWSFEKVGMSYRCWSDEIQTEFRLTHIKRAHGDLSGELSVLTNFKGVKTHNGVLHVARFNVLSTTARTTLARALEKRTPGFDMDWFDGLEWLCQSVILAEQGGEPVVDLSTVDPVSYHDMFLLEPFVLRGQPALLFGPGGVGKSLFALACGLSVSEGREIIPGFVPAVQGPVLYLDWETDKGIVSARATAIGTGHGFRPAGMYYRQCVKPLADDVEELSTLVASKGIVMVIVDSAGYAMGNQGEYGDANESVLRMHAALRLIGVGTQIIDHINKTDAKQKPGSATPYGSAYKTNAARTSWEVRKASTPTGLAINLFHAKANDSALLDPIGLSLDWTPDVISFQTTSRIDEEEAEPTGDDTAGMIRELLAEGEEMPLATIASTLATGERKENTVRTTVYRMAKRGELIKTERGNYKLTQVSTPMFRTLPGGRSDN